MKKETNHRHRWKYLFYGNKTVGERCRSCGVRRERYLIGDEKRLVPKLIKEMFGNDKERDVHLCYHDFCRKLKITGEYRWSGYQLMKKVEQWAKKWPNHAQVLGCDDSHHMSSYLLMIQHYSQSGRWMGITAITIPQNGERPSKMFLYPGDADDLMRYLVGAGRKSRTKEKPSETQIKLNRYRVSEKDVVLVKGEKNV